MIQQVMQDTCCIIAYSRSYLKISADSSSVCLAARFYFRSSMPSHNNTIGQLDEIRPGLLEFFTAAEASYGVCTASPLNAL